MIETLRTTPLFVLNLDVAYGAAVRLGERSVFPVRGGSFAGDRLNGVVVEGADWVRWRSDGAMLIDVRLTLIAEGGATVGMTYEGIARAQSGMMERFRRRELLPFDAVYIRTAIRFETAAPDLLWLNDIVAVGQGMRTEKGPLYHVFAID